MTISPEKSIIIAIKRIRGAFKKNKEKIYKAERISAKPKATGLWLLLEISKSEKYPILIPAKTNPKKIVIKIRVKNSQNKERL